MNGYERLPNNRVIGTRLNVVVTHHSLPHGQWNPTTSRGPLLGLLRCIGQALATEAIAESIRSDGVWEAESNIGLLGLVATLAAADWDALFTVKGINL
jgi:hypothetical protein